jgi:YfiH family protein
MFAETRLKGVHFFSFSEFSQFPHFICAMTSRQTDSELGQASHTSDLLKKDWVCELLGVGSNRLFLLRQVHSAKIAVVDRPALTKEECLLGPADGIILAQPGLFGAVRTADCLPAVVLSPQTGKLLMIHMGWRGAKKRILEKGLQAFLRLSGTAPEETVVGLGPCIRSCCYEVGNEVREDFEKAGFSCSQIFSGRHLDLIQTAQVQLAECGVRNVLDSGFCTACRTDLFYSYRQEATDSRMWTLAGFRR